MNIITSQYIIGSSLDNWLNLVIQSDIVYSPEIQYALSLLTITSKNMGIYIYNNYRRLKTVDKNLKKSYGLHYSENSIYAFLGLHYELYIEFLGKDGYINQANLKKYESCYYKTSSFIVYMVETKFCSIGFHRHNHYRMKHKTHYLIIPLLHNIIKRADYNNNFIRMCNNEINKYDYAHMFHLPYIEMLVLDDPEYFDKYSDFRYYLCNKFHGYKCDFTSIHYLYIYYKFNSQNILRKF